MEKEGAGMKKRVYATATAFLICLSLFCLPAHAQTQDESLFIAKDALKAMIGKGDITLVDLRFGPDWTDATLKIKGATHEDPMKPGQWIDKYAKDNLLIFY